MNFTFYYYKPGKSQCDFIRLFYGMAEMDILNYLCTILYIMY